MATRVEIALSCTACGARNYRTTRAVKPDAKPIRLKKFCTGCKKHTVHQETK